MLELPVPNDRFLLICFAFSSLRDSPDPKSIYDEIFKGNSSAHFIVFAQKFLSFFLPLRETSPDYNSFKILFKRTIYFQSGEEKAREKIRVWCKKVFEIILWLFSIYYCRRIFGLYNFLKSFIVRRRWLGFLLLMKICVWIAHSPPEDGKKLWIILPFHRWELKLWRAALYKMFSIQ